MKIKHLSFFILLFLLGACTQTSVEKKSYILINLAKNIDKTANNTTLNDFYKIERVIPLHTSDSFLLSNVSFIEVDDDEFIFNDRNAVYYVNKKSGKLRSMLNKKGKGPGEYIGIDGVTLDNQDNLLIYDINARKLLKYSPNGDFMSHLSGDSIGPIKVLSNGSYIVNHTPLSGSEYSLSIYDKSWNLIRRNISRDNTTDFAMINFDNLAKHNGAYYFKQAFGDTIYNVTQKADIPYLVLDKGKYKMPVEIATSLEKLDKEGSGYIQRDSYRLASNYMFLTYYYDNKDYYDIWDFEKEQLIYRGILDYKARKGIKGIPLLINGVQVDVWPSFALGDYLYCDLEAHEAMKFMPSVSEEDNPVIIELKLNRDNSGM